MSAVAFDTLKLARKLRESAQMSQEQAEGVSDALAEAMSGAELATKPDIRELAAETKRDIQELSTETKRDIAELAAATKRDIQELATETKRDIAELAAATKRDIRELELKLDARFETLSERIERRAAESDAKIQVVKNDLVRWLLGVGAAAILTIVGATWTIIRYLPPLPHG